MASQISDKFQFEGVEHAIAGISSEPLFEPGMLGLAPTGMCSLCWRGYQGIFSLSDSNLVLKTLHINLLDKDQDFASQTGPAINNVSPAGPDSDWDIFNNHYAGMDYRLDYTGGLLLADEFIDELSFHIGFDPAWKYKRVLELVFVNGVLRKEFDRSEQIANVRNTILETHDDNDVYRMSSATESLEFIGKLFDQTYQIDDGT